MFNLIRKYNPSVFRLSLCMMVLLMPFHFTLTNLFVVLLTLSWIFEGEFEDKIKRFINEPLILIFVLFYVFYCLGMLYTSNIKAGMFNLEKKISLLILPLVIGTSHNFTNKEKRLVIRIFLITCFLATIVCLASAVYRYLDSGVINVFLHEELTAIINFHPPYFGLYLSFGVLILIEPLFGEGRTLTMKMPIRGGLFLYFLFFLILLSARTVTVFLILIVIGGLVYSFYKRRKFIQGVIYASIITLSVSIFTLSSDYLRDRIVRPLTSDITVIDGGGETGLSIRIIKWKCSLVGFIEHPILGVGTGDAVDHLVSCYEREKFWGMYPQYRFNSHNQFLETALTLGLLGLTALIFCMAIPIRYALRRGNNLLFLFILLFAFCSLTESLLERQWGIMLFTFFVSVLSFGGKDSYNNSSGSSKPQNFL